jgi:hypothetical protein
MPWGIFFANQDDDNEEGFKDPDSNISYTSESVQDTLNQAAWFEEYGSGSDIRTADGRSPSECSNDARCCIFTTSGSWQLLVIQQTPLIAAPTTEFNPPAENDGSVMLTLPDRTFAA